VDIRIYHFDEFLNLILFSAFFLNWQPYKTPLEIVPGTVRFNPVPFKTSLQNCHGHTGYVPNIGSAL